MEVAERTSFYWERAEADTKAAEEASLPMEKARLLYSAKRWREMAESAEHYHARSLEREAETKVRIAAMKAKAGPKMLTG
jgi:hypothetical protein